MTAQFYSLEFNIDESTLTVRFTSQEDVLSIADPEIRVKMLSAILDRVDEQVDRVILDLSDLSRVNSAVLGFFVQLNKELEPKGVRFGVIEACPSVVKIMELTRLAHFLVDR